MTVSTIRQQLYDYIRVAEDRKVKAIHTMLEEEIAELYDHWNDETFTNNIEERSQQYKNGEVKSISWEAAQTSILNDSKASRK